MIQEKMEQSKLPYYDEDDINGVDIPDPLAYLRDETNPENYKDGTELEMDFEGLADFEDEGLVIDEHRDSRLLMRGMDHNMFAPLDCNANISTVDCTTTGLSTLLSSFDTDGRVYIPCGTCAYLDASLDIPTGLNIEGKLHIPSTAYGSELRTTSIIVQGVLQIDPPTYNDPPSANATATTTTALVNVATGKPATQSSECCGGSATKAVDGDTNGQYGGGSVTHTNDGAPWWKVDLGGSVDVVKVVLWNRMDCCQDRLKNFVLELLDASGTVVHNETHDGPLPDLTVPDKEFTFDAPVSDVQFVQVRMPNGGTISLAEVQVFSEIQIPSMPATIPTQKFKVVIFGTEEQTFTPHMQNMHACDMMTGCKAGKKPIAIAGGVLNVQGIEGAAESADGGIPTSSQPKGCSSWVKLHDMPYAMTHRMITLSTTDDDADLSCWRTGDEILLTSPDVHHDKEHIATIESIDWSTGNVILTEPIPVAFVYATEVAVMADDDVSGNTDKRMAIEVARLTRSVVFEAEEDFLWNAGDGLLGGHLIVLHTPMVAQTLIGVELINFGQQGKLGRYPIHFHMCNMVPGSYVAKNSVRDSNQRCIVIHGSHQAHLYDNIGHNAFGHCFFTEDGIENDNIFEKNLGANLKAPSHLIPGENDNSPAVFWITNPKNHWIGNVATGSASSGIWFDTRNQVRGPSLTHDTSHIRPVNEVIGSFRDNIVHSNNQRGIMLYSPGWRPSAESVLENNVVFRVRWEGWFVHSNVNVKIVGGLVADTGTGVFNFRAAGIQIDGIEFIGYSNNYKRVRSATNSWWYCPGAHSITGMTVHPWLVGFGSDYGLISSNLKFSHFGKDDTGCNVNAADPAAIRMSTTQVTTFYDTPNSFANITWSSDDMKKYSFCQAVNDWNISNILVEDTDGTLNGAATPGFAVSNDAQMTTFADSASTNGACVADPDSCSAFCEGACLRQVTFRVNNAYSVQDIEMVVSSQDGSTTAVMPWKHQYFHNTAEDHTSNHWDGKFGASLPPGNYVVSFRNKNTLAAAWPDYVEEKYERAPLCSPHVDFTAITTIKPDYSADRCPSNLIKFADFDDGKYDAWQHRNAELGITSPGAGNSNHALIVTKLEGNEFVSQNIDASCIKSNTVYQFMADIRLEANGEEVLCDPSIRGNCPRAVVMMYFWDSATNARPTTTKALAEIQTSTRSADGFYKLQGLVVFREADMAATRIEVQIERPGGVDYIIDNVSMTEWENPPINNVVPSTEVNNIAVGKTAKQSSECCGGSADKAVDGDTNGQFGGGSVTHTIDTAPWWKVDLGEEYDIKEIALWNRMDCCQDRLSDFLLVLSDSNGDPVYSHFHPGAVNVDVPDTYIEIGNIQAQYVAVYKSSGETQLSLAEVQVFAYYSMPSAAPSESPSAAPTISFAPTAYSRSALTNVALGKPATQSSACCGGVASKAVDGNTSGQYGDGSVTHTLDGEGVNSWWKVDLGQEFGLREVVLWNRMDCCNWRLTNFRIEFEDSSGNIVRAIDHPDTVDLTVPDTWFLFDSTMAQYVVIRLLSGQYLSLAEVQVFALYSYPSAAPSISLAPTMRVIPDSELTNIAVGKTATQSSECCGGSAPKAVDDNTNGIFWGGSVTHTTDGAPWWKLDLGEEVDIYKVILWNRMDCCQDRLKNFRIEFLNASGNIIDTATIVHPETVDTSVADTHFYLQRPARAQYVTVRMPSGGILSLAEVQVFTLI